uniref:Uncharacterized protein n=1 Tax=Acrobeloides nanus TaxID=290746 RepID=A0A914CDD5_9BILA
MFQECYYKHHGVHLKRELDAMRHHIIPGRPESTVIPIWYPVLSKLREEGYIIAVLTNNYWIDKAKTGKTTPLDEKHFDAIFESCKLGMRKPNPNIYQHVLNELKLEPEEAIFIDDVIQNLEGASRLGITTIHCTHVDKTIDDLEEILKISLNDKNN